MTTRRDPRANAAEQDGAPPAGSPGTALAPSCLAVDVGGTKMSAGIVDDRGSLRGARQVPTPVQGGAEELWDTLAKLVDQVRAEADGTLGLCGVGCGGPMTPGGELVSPLNIAGWRDFPLRQRLADHTGLPTTVDNDAKALALGEGWVGAARGVDNYLAMVVSTGIGGGVVLNGRLLEGRSGNAGHIGHVNVEPDGRRCRCGSRGCLEAEASGTAIAAITGGPPAEAPPEIVARAGTLVGRAVGSVCSLLDLTLTVVAGSVALGFGEPFFTAAQRELEARACLAFARGARVVPAGLGAAGPLIGAAAVGLRAVGLREVVAPA